MEIKIINLTNNFKYISGVDYDYESETDCNGGCNDDYCRCSRIVDPKVTSINVTEIKNYIVDSLVKDKIIANTLNDPFTTYCIERLMVQYKMYDINAYTLEVEGGYYGEETGDITFDSFNNFKHDLTHLVHLTTNKGKMEFILMKEYGKILDKLKDVEWSIENVKLSEIVTPNEQYANKLEKEGVEYSMIPSTYGVVFNKDDNTRVFTLIDGYHRYTQNKACKKDKEIQMVVARPKKKM